MAGRVAALSRPGGAAQRRLVLIEMSAEMGGVEYSTLYLVQCLDRAAWAPLVICPQAGPLVSHCQAAQVPCEIVPLPRMWSLAFRVGARWITNPLAWVVNALAFVGAAWRLAQVLRQHQAQLVCTKGLYPHFYGGLAALLAGVPCVWHLQDLLDSQRGFGLYPLLQSVGARFLAKEVLADGWAIARQLTPRLYPPQRVHVVYNGVNTAEFAPTIAGEAVRAAWGIPPEAVVIGVAARLTATKGQHVLLQAAPLLLQRFPQVWLVVIGSALFTDQHYATQLRALAAASGAPARIVFAGFRADLNHALAALDIFAYTATSHDTSPLALISALAAGKPCVVADIPGVAEIFHGDPKVVAFVPPADPTALAEALSTLVQDAALRQQQAAAARQIALERFSVEQFTRQCERVFEQVLEA